MTGREEAWKLRLKRALIYFSILLFACVLAAFVAVSPLILRDLSRAEGLNWGQLSSVGSTFGAVSAVIASLALLAVALSIGLSIRQGKASQLQQWRTLHVELLRISLDSPELLECWGPFGGTDDPKNRASFIYTNLIISHWQTQYEIGAISEVELRVISSALFQGATGQQFWHAVGAIRKQTSTTRRARKFHAILDEEFLGAVASSSASRSHDRPASAAPETGAL